MLSYPSIDPIIWSYGPIAIRWYGLAYIAGLVLPFFIFRKTFRVLLNFTFDDCLNFISYLALGVIIGGRFGYVLFYGFERLAQDPLYLVRVWEGGMSFHGGLIGVAISLILFCKRFEKSFLEVGDFLAPLCPIGLGLGRLANFVNAELPGRITESVTGLVYPCQVVRDLNPMCVGQWESVARHPSPLYQACTEGLILFLLLWVLSGKPRSTGFISGCFLLGYGSLRFFTEIFREPDSHIGFILFEAMTMGQLLCLPMIIIGSILILLSRRNQLT